MTAEIKSSQNGEVKNSQNGEGRHSNSKIKKINNLLNSSQTRVSGLELLSSYLPECSDEEFTEWCVSWMQHCCKIDGSAKSSNISIQILNDLLKISSNYTELKKSVSFFITTRFFDHFFKYYTNSQAGWTSALTCFLLYKGACGPYLVTVSDHLSREVGKNKKISPIIAACYALLPCLGGGGNEGVNYKKNWKSQLMKYVGVCHSILNDLFLGVVEELQEYDTFGYSYNKKKVTINAEFLTIQLHNNCAILSSMLLNKYPAPKCILTDTVLQMICRGLAANPRNLGQCQTTDIISLQKVLPEVHSVLHSLLKALVVTCGSQLLPYSHLVAKLIKQTLEWTESDFVYGSEKPFAALRVSAYETLCNWLAATRSGSCVETISKVVVSNAVADIHSKKTVTLLKESKRKEQSRGKETSLRRRIDSSANTTLCRAASKALQFVVKFSGVSLTAEEHKFLQEVVIKLLVDIQNSSASDILIPYSVPTCRKELYALLLELIHQPCMGRPPPTHFALRIFSRGQNDASLAVSEFCSSAINAITSITHSQFDNGGFGAATSESVRRQGTVQWNSEAMEVLSEADRSLGREAENSEPFCAAENDVNPAAVASKNEDDGEILSNQSESEPSSHEDSTVTVDYVEADENDKDSVEIVEEGNLSFAAEKSSEASREAESPQASKNDKDSAEIVEEENEDATAEKSTESSRQLESPPASKKSKIEESKSSPKEKTPSPVKAKEPDPASSPKTRDSTPQKQSTQKDEGKPGEMEDASSVRSLSSESPGDDKPWDPRKRYFLRSKTSKASSEEPEEAPGAESFRTPTPTRSLAKTPTTLGSKKRPRTRALSKIEETSAKKDGLDEDEDIIELFDDTFVD